MRKVTILFVWLIVLGVLITNSYSQNSKVGFINTLAVLSGTDEGRGELDKLEEFVEDKQKEVGVEAELLQELQEQYANQQRTLNAETRVEMERSMQEKDRALKRLQEDIQLELDQRRNVLLEKMSEKIRKIVNEYAPLNGYGVIFFRDQTQSYVDPSVEITQDIIRLYNEQYPVVAPGESE